MPFKRFRSGTPALDLVQDNVYDAVSRIDAGVLVEPVLTEEQTIGVTDTKVYHNLGRVPRGWVLVQPKGLAEFAEVTPSPSPHIYALVRASVATAAKFLFF